MSSSASTRKTQPESSEASRAVLCAEAPHPPVILGRFQSRRIRLGRRVLPFSSSNRTRSSPSFAIVSSQRDLSAITEPSRIRYWKPGLSSNTSKQVVRGEDANHDSRRRLLPLNYALDSHRGGMNLGRDRPQAQALFVEMPYRFQLCTQDFPFPPEMVRL